MSDYSYCKLCMSYDKTFRWDYCQQCFYNMFIEILGDSEYLDTIEKYTDLYGTKLKSNKEICARLVTELQEKNIDELFVNKIINSLDLDVGENEYESPLILKRKNHDIENLDQDLEDLDDTLGKKRKI